MAWRLLLKWWPFIWMPGIVLLWASGQLIVALGWVAIPSLALFWYGVQTGMTEQETLNRKKEGRCLNCGYSLRANLSGICPECGAATSTKSTTSNSTDQVNESSASVRKA